MVHHGLLHRMRRAVGGEVLHRQQLLAVESGEEQEAGVYGLLAACLIHENNGACAAIALGAAFLRAAKPFPATQILQHGHGRIDVAQLAAFRSQAKVEGVSHLGRTLPNMFWEG